MLPLLIFYVLKRHNVIPVSEKRLLKFKTSIQKILVLVMLSVFTCAQGFNNPDKETPKVFQIVKNHKVIGTISMVRKVFGDSIIYDAESQINVRFLLRFKITGKEKSVFRHGVLVYSSVYRELNNKVKANHVIARQGSSYSLNDNNKTEVLDINSIEQNLVTLYFQEPKNVTSIFCDNQKEMIQIKNLGQGKYKVEISNGKYNIFHYKDGKCVEVEAVSPMFDVILKPV